MAGLLRPVALALAALLGLSASSSAQTGAQVLLVSNSLSQPSEEIAGYYARKRIVPTEQWLRLSVPIAEEISRANYEAQIERPISVWLQRHAAEDRILYIVLTKDIPLRISGAGAAANTMASVDSELTLVYRKLAGAPVKLAGAERNPYFAADVVLSTRQPFTHKNYDFYLVTRLDGYTVDDVKGLIDRGSAPAKDGIIVLDGRFELSESVGTKWLNAAASAIKKIPGWSDKVVSDNGLTELQKQANVLGFYTWGSNATSAKVRRPEHQYRPGAIGAEFVSTDARTMTEPPADWVINDTRNPFKGSHQSLIGDLIRDGLTGVAGHVAEPFLNATIRPDVLFPAYLSGFNLAEAFYMAMPGLSWQTVVVGDPLCNPFGSRTIAADELSPAIDPVTELPAYFSARRITSLTTTGAKPDAVKYLAKSEARFAANDTPGAMRALEDATTSDPTLVAAHLVLAAMHEKDEHWDLAIARYRQVLTTIPNHAVALNNLAWLLATRKNDPAEALPLVTRAYAVTSDPKVGDTLAWVQHLNGDDQSAGQMIEQSVRRRPQDAELQLHAAIIKQALGNAAAAKSHLAEALRLQPDLAGQDDVKSLQAKLAAP